MKHLSILFIFLIYFNTGFAQIPSDSLPYAQIPEKIGEYTGGNVLSRIIDGLGFRYYWGTEGLTEKDLEFIPTTESRNTMETIEHLFGLSQTMLNGALNMPNVQPTTGSGMSFTEYREKTLRNIQESSKLLAGKSDSEISDLKVIFQRGESRTEYPFWNMMNGPIVDMIHHTGQLILLRRMSGNPINPKVNVFLGVTEK